MAAYRTADATVSAHGAVEVTPSDSAVIPVTRFLYIGTSGDLTVRMADGQTVVFKAVPVGIFNIQVDMVKVTAVNGASNIIALY